MKKLIAIIAFAAVGVVGVPMEVSAGGDTGDDAETGEADRTVTIEATDFDFDPKEIEIDASTTLKIVLANEGNVAHSWAVPELDKKSDRIQPGKQTSMTLNPNEPGTYKIACQVPGHEQVGMTGKLIVNSND